jgi:hypothetical protein
MRLIITTLIAALALTAPLAAGAQTPPSYADNGGDAQIRGRVVDFDGGYGLRVRDDRGYIDNVQLHPGTIINPTGLTLAPGMVVSVLGYNAGSSFAANEIDTPYTFYGSVPYYGGYPWSYYGAGVSLGFFFGNSGWWHAPGYPAAYRAYGYRGPVPSSYHGGYVKNGYHGAYPANGYHGAANGGYHGAAPSYHAPAGAGHAPGGAFHGAEGAHGGGGAHGHR